MLGVENQSKEVLRNFEVLLDTAINNQLLPLQSYQLQSVRNQKLWSVYHRFSLGEGLNLCKACNDSLKLEAHYIFWQIIIEEKVLSHYTSGAAKPDSGACPTTSASSRVLTEFEKNAIYYTAGAVVRKLTRKYTKNSGNKAGAYLTILERMRSKLSQSSTEKPLQVNGQNWSIEVALSMLPTQFTTFLCTWR